MNSKQKERPAITREVTIVCRRQGFPSWIAQVENYQHDGLASVSRSDPANAIDIMTRKVYRHLEHHFPGLEGSARLLDQPTGYELVSMDEVRYTWKLDGMVPSA